MVPSVYNSKVAISVLEAKRPVILNGSLAQQRGKDVPRSLVAKTQVAPAGSGIESG
jgi:hypothetical protein